MVAINAGRLASFTGSFKPRATTGVLRNADPDALREG